MDKKKLLVVLLGGVLLLLLTGCKCTPEQMADLIVINDSPADGTLISSLLPSFSWHSDSCEPSYYWLSIHENGSNYLYAESTQVPDNETSFDWVAPPLEPGKEYAWHVRPYLVDSGSISGSDSEETIFYTGPVCSGETLIAPEPHAPNWIDHAGPQEFNWTYPGGCLPISYDYQFASDIGFTDIILSGTTTEPYAQHMVQTFPNCSSVFWRVRANDGTSVGPWSDSRQFHWVTDETCWQLHYISDDAARIDVRLYDDVCNMTRYDVPLNGWINDGCKREYNSALVHGDGEYHYPPDYDMSEFQVDLGSGPCPSTGLDSREFGGLQYFYVVAPGTYCVSISKNQTAYSWFTPKNLMDGLWTNPLTLDTVAGKTIELGSGTQDMLVEFFWDEWDQSIVHFEVPENLHCRVGPDPICDPLKIPLAGEVLPILARDQETEWKMTSYEGETCFVYLTNAQINEDISKKPGIQLLTENLPFFDPQPSCPTPTPVPPEHQPTSPTGCAQYTTQRSCIAAKCNWFKVNDTTSLCIPY